MTTLTHIIVGAAAAKMALAAHALPGDPSTAYLIGIIAANLPDFDTPFVSVRLTDVTRNLSALGGVPFRKNHRTQSFFHYPVFWLVLFSLVALAAKTTGNAMALAYLPFVALNVAVHFIMDSFGIGGAGICWLAPVNRRVFSILPMHTAMPRDFRELVATYRSSALLKIEAGIGIACLWYLLRH